MIFVLFVIDCNIRVWNGLMTRFDIRAEDCPSKRQYCCENAEKKWNPPTPLLLVRNRACMKIQCCLYKRFGLVCSQRFVSEGIPLFWSQFGYLCFG